MDTQDKMLDVKLHFPLDLHQLGFKVMVLIFLKNSVQNVTQNILLFYISL